VLIFDEVVTGFRVSPGGAQAEYGIRPDLTTLAKILAGGLPGGAVAGCKDVLDLLDFHATKASDREKISHQGTFNANPLSAAAGVAALEIVGTTDACARANRYGETLRRRINEIFEEEHVPWAAYGTFSMLHINPDHHSIVPTSFDPLEQPAEALAGNFRRHRLGEAWRGRARGHPLRPPQERAHAEAGRRDLALRLDAAGSFRRDPQPTKLAWRFLHPGTRCQLWDPTPRMEGTPGPVADQDGARR